MNTALLEKYLKGNCSPEEAKRIKEMLDADPSILDAYMLRAATEPVTEPMPEEMAAELLSGFRREWASHNKAQEEPARISRMAPLRRILGWSAAAAILTGVLMLGWFSGKFRTADYALLEANTGVVKQAFLPDHSVIWLKPGAKLRFDQKAYGTRQRFIELLEGEAFFDVVHNAASPFIVQSGNISTTDIGTSFDIHKDDAHLQVTVTVATGEVATSQNDRPLKHILPGERLAISTLTGQYTRSKLPGWMASIWKENSIQLTNVSFAELTMAMQQLYGVHLQTLQASISEQTYTIQLKRQTPPDQVICLLGQNQYRKKTDGTYLIY